MGKMFFTSLIITAIVISHLVDGRFDAVDPVVPCSLETCFDVSKCATSPKIYVYPIPSGQLKPTCNILSQEERFLYQACILYTLMSDGFQLTEDPAEACLLVPSLDATCSMNFCSDGDLNVLEAALHSLPYWNEGKNHIIFNYNNDWPNPGFDVGKAILVRVSMLNETYRPDFDVALPVTRPIFREPSPLVVHLGSLTSMETTEPAQLLQPIMRGRDLLLYFRGCAQRFGTPGMCEDRVNIFADHFPPPVDQPDVVILAICCGNHDGGLKTLSHCRGCYDNVRIENGQSVNCTAGWPDVSFDDGIRRAKFTFTPRGCGPLTYRMLEAIGAGSVPVLTGRGTFIPFAGEGHLGQLWRQCVIHTPEAQLPQLISSLRAMSDAEYHFRLLACAQIAALQSHSIQVTTKQTICIILFRIATLLKRQRNGELPVWLSTAGTALRGELGLPFETTTVPYSRVLIAQCSHVGVPLGHL